MIALVYSVKADRFLRGMVRALTATMLKIGRGKIYIGTNFRQIIEAKDCTLASFARSFTWSFSYFVNFHFISK